MLLHASPIDGLGHDLHSSDSEVRGCLFRPEVFYPIHEARELHDVRAVWVNAWLNAWRLPLVGGAVVWGKESRQNITDHLKHPKARRVIYHII